MKFMLHYDEVLRYRGGEELGQVSDDSSHHLLSEGTWQAPGPRTAPHREQVLTPRVRGWESPRLGSSHRLRFHSPEHAELRRNSMSRALCRGQTANAGDALATQRMERASSWSLVGQVPRPESSLCNTENCKRAANRCLAPGCSEACESQDLV